MSKASGKRLYEPNDLQQVVCSVVNSLVIGDHEHAVCLLKEYSLLRNEDIKKSKKVLLLVDKLIKYVKQTPSFSAWCTYMETEKGNKVLDTMLRQKLLEERKQKTVPGVRLRVKKTPKIICLD